MVAYRRVGEDQGSITSQVRPPATRRVCDRK
jgi:hypothetical protein